MDRYIYFLVSCFLFTGIILSTFANTGETVNKEQIMQAAEAYLENTATPEQITLLKERGVSIKKKDGSVLLQGEIPSHELPVTLSGVTRITAEDFEKQMTGNPFSSSGGGVSETVGGSYPISIQSSHQSWSMLELLSIVNSVGVLFLGGYLMKRDKH